MFTRPPSSEHNTSSQITYKEGQLLPYLSPTDLLESFKFQSIISTISELADVSSEHFSALYLKLIYQFANVTQSLPRQTNGRLGELLKESLARAILALQQAHQDKQTPLQKYAIFSAALLNDINKIVLNHIVIICDDKGNYLREWNPFEGAMNLAQNEYYKLHPKHSLNQRLRTSMNILLARQIMPKMGFSWISSHFATHTQWLDALNEEDSGSGTLKRYLSLILLEDLEALLAKLGQLDLDMIHPLETKDGEAFYRWLRDGINNDTIKVNTADADIHTTDAGMFIDNKVIKQFVDLSPGTISLYAVRQQFYNAFGIAIKDGNDFTTAMFYGTTTSESGGKLLHQQQRNIRQGVTIDRQLIDPNGKHTDNSTHARSQKVKHSQPPAFDTPRHTHTQGRSSK